jgi:hypothetical protein
MLAFSKLRRYSTFISLFLCVSVVLVANTARAEEPQAAAAPRQPAADDGKPLIVRRGPLVPSPKSVTGSGGEIFLDQELSAPVGIFLRAKAVAPYILAQTGTANSSSAFIVYNSSGVELLRVNGNGLVGLGLSSPPAAGLHISGDIYTSLAIGRRADVQNSGTLAFDSSLGAWHMINGSGELVFLSGGVVGSNAGTERMRITPQGWLGIGYPSAPSAALHVRNSNSGMNVKLGEYAHLGTLYSTWSTVIGNNVRASDTATVQMETVVTHPSYAGSAILINGQSGIEFHTKSGAATAGASYSSPRMLVKPDGRVQVGVADSSPVGANDKLVVYGDATVTGRIGATYQDVAEWVPSSGPMSAGSVVVVSSAALNTVTLASQEYDTRVAGVVSAQPGIILGVDGPSKAMIATTGRVKVRVDAGRHPIAAGDLLVSSSKPGVAMKSEPLEIGGMRMHRPGTLIGKALEPLQSGEGEILVLLSLQ